MEKGIVHLGVPDNKVNPKTLLNNHCASQFGAPDPVHLIRNNRFT